MYAQILPLENKHLVCNFLTLRYEFLKLFLVFNINFIFRGNPFHFTSFVTKFYFLEEDISQIHVNNSSFSFSPFSSLYLFIITSTNIFVLVSLGTNFIP